MPRHYLSREMRNAETSVALCGYRFTSKELDWSRNLLLYTFFPYRVSCDDCSDAISRLVPDRHWDRRVEIFQPAGSQEWRYIAFYPDRLVHGDQSADLAFINPLPNSSNPAGPLDNPDLPYLEFQNIYDIQKTLAQSAEKPWHYKVHSLRSNATHKLPEAVERLKRTMDNEFDPKHRYHLQLAAEQLKDLHAQLEVPAADQKTDRQSQEQFHLTPEQIESFEIAWNQLESLRHGKALSLRDIMAPSIDGVQTTDTTAEDLNFD